jgi:hypothetical protein
MKHGMHASHVIHHLLTKWHIPLLLILLVIPLLSSAMLELLILLVIPLLSSAMLEF